jgi:selenium metabolism protein YedF
MEFLDCSGKTCPQPVIETKALLDSKSPDQVKIAVDNEASRENVRRFLESRGYRVSVEQAGERATLFGTKQEGQESAQAEQPAKAKVCAFIAGETMGRGSDELGAILMKSFLFSLKELTPLPWRILLVNAGIKLSCEGSELLPHLKELEEKGVELLSCGTCLDFYNLKEKLRVGRVTNMFEIVSTLSESTAVLKP